MESHNLSYNQSISVCQISQHRPETTKEMWHHNILIGQRTLHIYIYTICLISPYNTCQEIRHQNIKSELVH